MAGFGGLQSGSVRHRTTVPRRKLCYPGVTFHIHKVQLEVSKFACLAPPRGPDQPGLARGRSIISAGARREEACVREGQGLDKISSHFSAAEASPVQRQKPTTATVQLRLPLLYFKLELIKAAALSLSPSRERRRRDAETQSLLVHSLVDAEIVWCTVLSTQRLFGAVSCWCSHEA